MTEEDLFDIISSVGIALKIKDSVITESFITRAMNIHYSFSPLVQAEVHHEAQNFLNRAKRSVENVPLHLIGYACFIFASIDAQKKLAGESKLNLRFGKKIEDLPAYQKAQIQTFMANQKTTKKGPSNSTNKKLKQHAPTIESMSSIGISTRVISKYLEDEFKLKVSHTTLSRYIKAQKQIFLDSEARSRS
jgi:hypothetical protein